MKEVEKHGVKIKEPTGPEIRIKLIQTFFGNLLAAFATAMIVFLSGVSGWSNGLEPGLICSIGFAAAAIIIAYTWESRSFKLMAIDSGYALVGITSCAIILSCGNNHVILHNSFSFLCLFLMAIGMPYFGSMAYLHNSMKVKGFFILTGSFIVLASCSHKIKPEKPSFSQTNFKLDSLPNSEINIPIQINLKPVYAMAEKVWTPSSLLLITRMIGYRRIAIPVTNIFSVAARCR